MAPTRLEGNLPGAGYVRLELDRERIARVSIDGPEQPGAPVLSPGLIDLQLNGFAGVDFSDPALEAERAASVLPHLWKTGVASFCPTLITNTRERIARNLRVLERARGADARFGNAVPCYHLEGPYLSPGPSRGVHDPACMHAPDWHEFEEFQDAAGGRIGIVTLAPEWPGSAEFIARASASGVVVALGHTDASPEQIHSAVDAGARLSTHLGNGCPQMLDRHAAPLWAQLARPELSASLICDTFHLPADVVKVFVAAKGLARCILVTDAMYVATLAPGRYPITGTEIELLPEGKVIKADGACLGGSAVTMNREVALFMRLAGVPLAAALRAATENPAALLNRDGVCGKIAPGNPANLLLSHLRADRLEIRALYLGGDEVCRVGQA